MDVIPKPAQYLLRVDDLCPTHAAARWERLRELIEEYRIRPILAVIPDNRDPQLNGGKYEPRFWDQMREMEAAGAAIGVHGYQHRCHAMGASLLGLDQRSEFAGVDPNTQRAWIRAGFEILREKGLHPRVWIAPRHGFDRNTLGALQAEGVEYISDGFGRVPHRRHGVIWIPQQLWSPVAKSKGLWTICIHPHVANDTEVERLRWFLQEHRAEFTSFERVVKEFEGRALGPGERVYEQMSLWRVQWRRRRHGQAG